MMETSKPHASSLADLLYPAGSTLSLEVSFPGISGYQTTPIQAEVKQQQRPWTLSCGTVVETVSGSLGENQGNEQFLKMFDRRGAEQMRHDNFVSPWSQDIEDEFVEGLQSGKVETFVRNLRTVPDFKEKTEDDWDTLEEEAYINNELRNCFEAEREAYARLERYQGKCIPFLFATVKLDIPPPKTLSLRQRELYKPKGILLQYLSGFTLSDMIHKAPRSSWQGIVDKAVEIVHILGDHNILNRDVRPDNFMVVPRRNTYQVFMIDFGHCRFRREGESDEKWGREKAFLDEEGAVALVMKKRLRKVGFELRYEPSERYEEWAPGADDDLYFD